MAFQNGESASWAFVSLDGTLIEVSHARTKVAARAAGDDLRCSGEHHFQGGKIQALTTPSGFPVWTAVAAGTSVQGLTCTRTHALAALYPSAAAGLPRRRDQGCTPIDIHVPPAGAHLSVDTLREKAQHYLRTYLRIVGRVFTALADQAVVAPHHQDAAEPLEWHVD